MTPAFELEDFRHAIEHLRPELPSLVGSQFVNFEAQLDSALAAGSINRMLDLFRKYPAAHQRLLQVLPSRKEDLTKGLFGDIKIALPYLYYVCPVGPHLVQLKRMEEQDAAGRALCAVDHQPMRCIGAQGLRAALEMLQPELSQLLGPGYLDLAAKLNASLKASNDDPAWTLIRNHEILCRRLLQILAVG